MTQFRKVWVGVLCLAVALALTPAFAPAAEVHKLLPDDTSAVISVNVRQIMDSPLAKKYALDLIKQAINDQAGAKKVLEALGLDPLKDIDQLIVAAPDLSDTDEGLVIVTGKFDPAKIRNLAAEAAKNQADQFKIHKAGDYTLYEIKAPDLPAPAFAAVADKNTLVIAPKQEYAVAALDKAAGKKTTALKNKAMGALLQQIDGKQSVWVAVAGSALEKGIPGLDDPNVKEFLSKLDAVAGGLTVTDDIKAQFVLNAKDVKGAKELSQGVGEGINQGLVIIALLAGQQKELAPLVDVLKGVKVNQRDKSVVITGEVTKDVIEQLMKLAGVP